MPPLCMMQRRQNRLKFATSLNSMVCRRMTSIMDWMMSARATRLRGAAG